MAADQRERPDGPRDDRRGLIGALVATAVTAVVMALLGIAVWDAHATFGMPDPVSADGDAVVRAWRLLLVLAAVVTVVVLVLIAVAVVGGARRRVPSSGKGNVPVEVVYTAAPLALVGVLLGLSVWLGDVRDDRTAREDVSVTVEGFRWGWRFTYADGRRVVGSSGGDDPVLVLPVDRTAVLRLRSPDVIHSFFVPAFGTKLDVVPGQRNELRVHPTVVGTYTGHCAEYCGLDHARMNFRIAVVTQAEFDAWRPVEVGG